MTRWTASDIPPQIGKTALVTGSAGLGFETARELARAGAQVIVASRNPETGAEALARIKAEIPNAVLRFEAVDLGSLASVSALAARLRDQTQVLDLLVNNAGIMTPPRRMETTDGFELQFGTNHLAHFALTGLLLPLLVNAEQARVVTLSSIAARGGKIDFADLQQTDYRPMLAYSQSKLACLMFGLELQRRSLAEGWGLTSIPVHPGISRTGLLLNTPGGASGVRRMIRGLLWFLFQPVPQGALPALFAATAPQAQGGVYYGPDGRAELSGFPAEARIPAPAFDEAACRRLWEISEALTGVRFEAGR